METFLKRFAHVTDTPGVNGCGICVRMYVVTTITRLFTWIPGPDMSCKS